MILTSNEPIGFEKIGKVILNKVKAGFSVSIAFEGVQIQLRSVWTTIALC